MSLNNAIFTQNCKMKNYPYFSTISKRSLQRKLRISCAVLITEPKSVERLGLLPSSTTVPIENRRVSITHNNDEPDVHKKYAIWLCDVRALN